MQNLQDVLYLPTEHRLNNLDVSSDGSAAFLSLIALRIQNGNTGQKATLNDCMRSEEMEAKDACRLIILGNSLNDGKFETYKKIMKTWNTKQIDQIEKDLGGPNADTLEYIKDRQLSNSMNNIIPLPSESDGFLKDTPDPIIGISVNGRNGKALFDTGAGITIISEADAAKYKITKTKSLIPSNSGYSPETQKNHYGIAEQIQIGSAKYNNVLVSVGGALSVIGIDLISGFTNIVIENNRITLNIPSPELYALEEKCVAKVFLGSTLLRRTQFLYTNTSIAGTPTPIMIDTGNPYYFSGGLKHHLNAGKIQNSQILSDINGSHTTFMVNSSEPISFGGVTKNVPYTGLANQQYPLPYLLGWRAFQDHDLIWNIHESRACLTNKTAAR